MQNRWIFFVVAVYLGVLLFFSGCATIVKDSTLEKPAVSERKVPAESESDKIAREKAMREAEIRERDRQRAEREKAERERTAGGTQASLLAGFDYIYFDFDKYTIQPEARSTLHRLAAWVQANPGVGLVIEGNCDERGTTEYNMALAEKRAISAMKYLESLGIDKKKISTISYGKERPIDPGHDETAWANNRNDHFVAQEQE